MPDFMNAASPESIKAGERFIQRIKSGIISKNNRNGSSSFEEYPLEKASENFTLYLESEDFKKLTSKQ